MKKLFLLLIVVAVFAGCSKDEVVESIDSINLKDWVLTVNLMAAQHDLVGSVTYIHVEDPDNPENDYIQVTFNMADGYTMSESHVYYGLDVDMPTNGPGAPKIGKFPYQRTYDPPVSTDTYTFPAGDPASEFAYSIAAHCVVIYPDGTDETGWAAGNKTFSDKGWGTYTEDFYNNSTYINPTFYGIEQNDDGTLVLVLINGGANQGNIILSEAITAGGTIEAAAYDPSTGNLFFVIGNTLYVNNMGSEELSVIVGILPGLPIGGVFLNGNYYYIDGDPSSSTFNSIIQVLLTPDGNGGWTLTETVYSDVIPYNLEIIDLATDGTIIYFIGINDGGTPLDGTDDWVDMFTYDGSVFSAPVATELSGNAQIAYGADGLMYTIDVNGVGYNVLLYLDPGTGETDSVVPGGDELKDGDDNSSDIPISDFVEGY